MQKYKLLLFLFKHARCNLPTIGNTGTRFFSLKFCSQPGTMKGALALWGFWEAWGFPRGSVVKSLPTSAEDSGLVPGLGRSPGWGNGSSLLYSCLKKPMDREAWWVQTMELLLTRLLCPWGSPGKNTAVGCNALPDWRSPDPGQSLYLLWFLHWQVDSLPLVHIGLWINK